MYSNMFKLSSFNKQSIQTLFIQILCSILYEIRYLFYIFSTSQFELAIFELCNNYMWLVATLMDSNLLKTA